MKGHLIPLGLRCNAALITNAIVNQPRFPFDWVQMNAESMRDVIYLEAGQIKDYWISYFSNLDDTNHNVQTGSWFPHDSFSTEKEKDETIQKYVRRTERFLRVLDSSDHVVYLIVFGFPEYTNIDKILEVTFAIRNRHIGSYSFIICNGMIPEDEKEDTVFLYEKLGGEKGYEDWEDLAKRLEQRVRNHLASKNIEAVPFLIENTEEPK
jgi:hypothetical protein